jgi:enediyne biosynthesis protein E4
VKWVLGLLLLLAPQTIVFRDVARSLEFNYTSNNSYTGRKYFPQPMCGGVAVFDYDNDGLLDIYFTNGAKLPELKKTGPQFHHLLLRNRGKDRFEDVTERAGLTGAHLDFSFGVAAGDYDNDGFTDLFVANAGMNALYRNTGDGAFTDVTAGSGLDLKPPETLSVQAAWVDYDRDGLLDLVLSNYTFWTPEKDRVCKSLGEEIYCNPKVYPAVPHRLYRNLGGGKFEDRTEAAGFSKALGKGMGIGLADMNRDGWMDIFVANDTERNFLYLNQKDGTFKEVGILFGIAYDDNASTVSAMGCDVKDYDNDGWPDVFYNNLMNQIHGLFRNERGRGFRYVSPGTGIESGSRLFSGWSCGFIDFDNDGWKDIYSANGHVDDKGTNTRQHDTLLRNIDGKRFADVSSTLGADFKALGYHRGSAFGDLNNDGWMDLVVTGLNERPRILLNSGLAGRNWIAFSLTGTKSNRDAIGAEVKVTTASGRVLHNHVSVSVGFMSSSDRRVHFGLGTETSLQEIEIRWPSGMQQSIKPIEVNRYHSVVEPD